jgi:hypothetical protein
MIIMGLFAVSLVTSFIKRLPKYRRRIMALPKDKLDILTQTSLSLILIYKILLIMAPVYLGLFPYLLYHYAPKDFIYGIIIILMMYLSIIGGYLFRKSLVKEMQKREAN